MLVKIGDKVYNSILQPIAIKLSNREKELISNMPDEISIFCSFSSRYDKKEIEEFIKDLNDDRYKIWDSVL